MTAEEISVICAVEAAIDEQLQDQYTGDTSDSHVWVSTNRILSTRVKKYIEAMYQDAGWEVTSTSPYGGSEKSTQFKMKASKDVDLVICAYDSNEDMVDQVRLLGRKIELPTYKEEDNVKAPKNVCREKRISPKPSPRDDKAEA